MKIPAAINLLAFKVPQDSAVLAAIDLTQLSLWLLAEVVVLLKIKNRE